MAKFKMYECDFVVVIDGTTYTFPHVDKFVIEDPERVKLIRGSNEGNKEGIAYKEGVKEAKTATLTVIGMSKEIHDLLKTAYKEKKRMDAGGISRVDGSSRMLKLAVLSQPPFQASMDDSAESMNIDLSFESYDFEELYKS